MSFIYRRFFIVGLFIAAFAGVTANIIVHTKTQRSNFTYWNNTPFNDVYNNGVPKGLPYGWQQKRVQNDAPERCIKDELCFSVFRQFATYG
ncbi:MAG: hypothetical protein AB8B49_06005 [Nitratireductor sp.]